jgi:hypothetical protein
MRHTIAAKFDRHAAARQAAQALRQSGFSDSLVVTDETGSALETPNASLLHDLGATIARMRRRLGGDTQAGERGAAVVRVSVDGDEGPGPATDAAAPAREPGRPAHPVGIVGATAGGVAAGALSGIAAGPVGSLAGAVAGAAIGSAVGGGGDTSAVADAATQDPRSAADALSPERRRRAVELGRQARQRYGPGAQWSDAQAALSADWKRIDCAAPAPWALVQSAVREGWDGKDGA